MSVLQYISFIMDEIYERVEAVCLGVSVAASRLLEYSLVFGLIITFPIWMVPFMVWKNNRNKK